MGLHVYIINCSANQTSALYGHELEARRIVLLMLCNLSCHVWFFVYFCFNKAYICKQRPSIQMILIPTWTKSNVLQKSYF